MLLKAISLFLEISNVVGLICKTPLFNATQAARWNEEWNVFPEPWYVYIYINVDRATFMAYSVYI